MQKKKVEKVVENKILDEVNEKDLIIEKLTAENKELNDKLLRALSDLQNYRKRKDEEVERMLKYSDEDFILELLPIIDNFERAIMLDDQNLNDELSKFLQGFKMIYTNILNVLTKFEVKAIDGINKEFNPVYHQAVLTDSINNYPDNHIIDILQKGYLLKDKVIRPAMVKVNINKGEMKNE